MKEGGGEGTRWEGPAFGILCYIQILLLFLHTQNPSGCGEQWRVQEAVLSSGWVWSSTSALWLACVLTPLTQQLTRVYTCKLGLCSVHDQGGTTQRAMWKKYNQTGLCIMTGGGGGGGGVGGGGRGGGVGGRERGRGRGGRERGRGVGKERGWGGKGYTMSQMETPLIDQSLLSLVDCAVTPL